MEKTPTHHVASYVQSKNDRWKFSPASFPILVTIFNIRVWVCNSWGWSCTSDSLIICLVLEVFSSGQGSELAGLGLPGTTGHAVCCAHVTAVASSSEIMMSSSELAHVPTCQVLACVDRGELWHLSQQNPSLQALVVVPLLQLPLWHCIQEQWGIGDWVPVLSQPALKGSQKSRGGSHSSWPFQAFRLDFMASPSLEYRGC